MKAPLAPGQLPTEQEAQRRQSSYMVDQNPKGLIEPGNLNIRNRPTIENDDGSHSSELSFSREENGKEVLVPSIVNGRFMTPDGKMPPMGHEVDGKYVPTSEEQAMYDRAWQRSIGRPAIISACSIHRTMLTLMPSDFITEENNEQRSLCSARLLEPQALAVQLRRRTLRLARRLRRWSTRCRSLTSRPPNSRSNNSREYETNHAARASARWKGQERCRDGRTRR